MAERGWRVVSVSSGEKGCRLPGWDKLCIGPDDVAKHFKRNSNIAVVLGPGSGELVDIDLDCAEALTLADIYLPETHAQFGRPSKPRSHRLYIAPGAIFEPFADPLLDGKNTLVEQRAQGRDGGAHQTLFPPSIADGEQREWHGDVIAPAVVSAATLRHRVALLAIGCLVFRYVSPTAAQNPGPDLPDILWEFDRSLGRRAFDWLGRAHPDAPRKYPKPRRQLSQSELDLAEIVDAIPNDGLSFDEWNKIGMAIFSVDSSEHGLIIFDDFSANCPAKYDPHTVKERWRNYHRSPPNRTGIGKLISLALQQGWRPKDAAE